VLAFTHPQTGLTIRALKAGEFPVGFDLVKRLNLLKDRFARLDACNEDFVADGDLDVADDYCSCIGNIGYGREPQANGGSFVSTCTDEITTVAPGQTITRPKHPRINSDVANLDVTCTAQDLRNRRDGAREALDEFTDYVNDLRTYNKLISNF
jgi:hypothetical protein